MFDVVRQRWQFGQDLDHIARTDDLLLELNPLKRQGPTQNCQRNEVIIRQQLRRGERAERIDEQFRATRELADRERMQALIDFETVTPVPVTTLLDELFCAR